MCRTTGADPSCAFDAPAHVGSACHLFDQTGCSSGQKCTWIETSGSGAIGCAPAGPVGRGSACAYGSGGFDNCVASDVCSNGACAPICELAGSSCATCTVDPALFGSPPLAGVCDRGDQPFL